MKSLGFRLAFWYMMVVTVTVAVVLLIGGWLLQQRLLRGVDLLNRAEFQEIKNRVMTAQGLRPEDQLLQILSEHAALDAPLYFFQLRQRNGEIVFRSPNMGKASLPAMLDAKPNWTFSIPSKGSLRIGRYPLGDYTMEIASSISTLDSLFRGYSEIVLILMGVVLVLGFLLGSWMSRLALNPIRRIQKAALHINADSLSERIPVQEEKGEIADLARLLNAMFDRLEKSFDRLWRFAGDASHELKTPLSLVRLQSEKLLLEGNLLPGQQEAVHQQLENITRLNSVIEKLLFLAKSEVGGIKLNLKQQNTHDLIQAFAEDAQALCEDRKVVFQWTEPSQGLIHYDMILLRQVLLNVVANALNFSPPNAEIHLTSMVEAHLWQIVVEDRGPGLAPEDLGEVLKPFVRANQDQAHETGTGLGLAICRTILDLHGGHIRLRNRTDGSGLQVCIEIPAATLPVH